MDDHNEMYEIGLTAPMEMAEEYRLDEMLPMMGLKIGKRCIILISRSVNAAEILDTLETLRCAEEKLMVVLEDACGRCDSVCEAQALPTDNTEKKCCKNPGCANVRFAWARSVPAAACTASGEG